MKKYHETWTEDEIDEYVEEFGVLVLFKIHHNIKEAEIIIHGNLSTEVKGSLKEAITGSFGGKNLTPELCLKINALADKWYQKFTSRKPLYVLNFMGE